MSLGLTLTMNGKQVHCNIGCRTFISLAELLRLMGADPSRFQSVEVNGATVGEKQFASSMIKAGDRVAFGSAG